MVGRRSRRLGGREGGVVGHAVGQVVQTRQLGGFHWRKLEKMVNKYYSDKNPFIFLYLAVSEVSGNHNGRQSGLVHFCVVVRVDADLLPPEVEGVGAVVDRLEFMVRLQVGVAPQATVDDVRKALLL